MLAMTPCPYCGGQKPEHLTECSGCWEVRSRLPQFLRHPLNLAFTLECLDQLSTGGLPDLAVEMPSSTRRPPVVCRNIGDLLKLTSEVLGSDSPEQPTCTDLEYVKRVEPESLP